MKLVYSDDWTLVQNMSNEQIIRMLLLDDDLRSAQISFSDYKRVRNSIFGENPVEDKMFAKQAFHYAKSYICAMRRVGRLFEDLSSNRSLFDDTVSETIKLVWKKKRMMFNSFIDPRNIIEHIDGEIKGKTRWKMMVLKDDELAVTEDFKIEISQKYLNSAIDGRNEIVNSILKSYQ